MKKLINVSGLVLALVFVGLVAFGNTAKAQPNIGIKAGLGFANISAEGVELDSRIGLAGGAYTSIELAGSPITIQPEVLYVQKGAKGTGVTFFGQPVQDAEYTYKFDYIEIPALGKYTFGGGGSSITPYAVAGPYLGFNANAELTIENAGNASGTFDVSDSANSTVFGLALGAGAAVNEALDIEARLDLGLSDSIENSDANNSAFLITAGYSF